MFHKTEPLGELSISATAASSPLIHDCIPSMSVAESDRRFFLLMPNKPRYLDIAEKRFVQQPGECALADSTVAHAAAYQHPHATICLSIPTGTLRRYVPEPERLIGTRLAGNGMLSRLISMLLVSIWTSAGDGTARSDGLRAAYALLGILARYYGRSPPRAAPRDAPTSVSCEQVKRLINAEIRNPALSVQFVAKRIGVTTRYLQLLFSQEDECVSQYIRRERLLGCLLDLRDADFDHQSITDIAFSWGFNSGAHFSSSFKREFGLNPRDYRSCDLKQLEALRLPGVEGTAIEAVLLLSRATGFSATTPTASWTSVAV
jgi:AraC-like DNA-binding protein